MNKLKSILNAFRSVLMALYGVVSTFIHLLIIYCLKLIEMAKKKKKDLDINIDTKKVDIHLTRKDGKTDVVIDTEKVDVELTKDETGLKVDVKAEGDAGKLIQIVRNAIRTIRKARG